MCGIVAYIGNKQACPILVKGLQRLEYRGYDSAGVALVNGELNVYKTLGKVADLANFIADKETSGTTGIAHTRWATHGEPSNINAHPHYSPSRKLALIHNGIIENYAPLREMLIQRGYVFQSETDTEVLIYLIEDILVNEKVSLAEAVRIALNQVIGAYAIVIISQEDPDEIIGARKGSPLVVGIGEDEFFIASDPTPIIEYTKNVVYLNDKELVILRRNHDFTIKTINNEVITPYIQEIVLSLQEIEKGGYDHFMLKEIFEQPRSIRDSIRGRLDMNTGMIKMAGIIDYENRILNARRFIFTAAGTSWHAGLVGEYLFEELARVPVEVEYASEFRYRNPIINEDDVVVAISQSGETADTLAAISLARDKGAFIFGICNVVGSSIARSTHAGAYTHAGPEIGVASTKAFTAQVTVLSLMALLIAQRKGTISQSLYHQYINELNRIPEKVEQTIKKVHPLVKDLAAKIVHAPNALYLGRGFNFPVALEGALKLKEISYIHAEGYPAAEMKHGPIALIDQNMPVIVIATNSGIYEKIVSNISEVKTRHGIIIAIVNEGDTQAARLADYIIEVPVTDEIFSPIITTIPLQLLAYEIAVLRDCPVDQPRNLAKSVTVE